MDPAAKKFVDEVPLRQKPLFDRLQTLILELHPEAEVGISYGIPTYKVGRNKVFLGLWKNGVSVHAIEKSSLEAFRKLHPSIKTGKGSLNFKVTDDLPEEDVREAIKRSLSRA